MSTKVKKTEPVKISLDEARNAAQSYANCEIAIQKKELAFNEALAKLKAKHEPFISEARQVQEEAAEVLEAYAELNKEAWEGKKMSVGIVTFGYRTGPRAVQVREKVEVVISWLKEAGLKRFLRVKEELDKPAMLKEKNEAVVNQLAECQISFAQSETFFVDVKK